MEWISISKAAQSLGVTDRTIYNRIKAGSVEHRKTPMGKAEVFIDPMKPVSDATEDLRRIVAAEVAMKGVSANTLQKTTEAFQSMHDTMEATVRRVQFRADIAWVLMLSALGVLVWGGWHYRGKIADADIQHTEDVAKMQGDHNGQVVELESAHRSDLEQIAAGHREQTDQADAEHQRQIAQAQAVADRAEGRAVVLADQITVLREELSQERMSIAYGPPEDTSEAEMSHNAPQLVSGP